MPVKWKKKKQPCLKRLRQQHSEQDLWPPCLRSHQALDTASCAQDGPLHRYLCQHVTWTYNIGILEKCNSKKYNKNEHDTSQTEQKITKCCWQGLLTPNLSVFSGFKYRFFSPLYTLSSTLSMLISQAVARNSARESFKGPLSTARVFRRSWITKDNACGRCSHSSTSQTNAILPLSAKGGTQRHGLAHSPGSPWVPDFLGHFSVPAGVSGLLGMQRKGHILVTLLRSSN